ncbi:MAG: ribosomal protein glutamine methyltransferase [Pseudomonadota bacterium]|jgi:ribosomal protein L3 glutamine methyltransferase
MTTLRDLLVELEKKLQAGGLYFGHGTNNAWDEAVQAAAHILQLSGHIDASEGERILTQEQVNAIEHLVERRITQKIPLPYLTHEAWFAGFPFFVDNRVIVPRSPFGELIEQAFEPWLGGKTPARILDLCTGSACMAIACAYYFPDTQIDAVDISKEALAVAKKNILKHDCIDQVHLLESDLFTACKGRRYDIIISNPPYVDKADMEALPQEFHFEPTLALAAGEDGLSIVHRILNEAGHYLTEEGLLIVEVGNSEEALIAAYPTLPFVWLEFERGGTGVFLLSKKDLNKHFDIKK